MTEIEQLKQQLNDIKIITCSGPGMIGGCNYQGAPDTFLPNYSGIHNACRCPQCGSTRNNYNRLHSRLVTLQCKQLKD